jgi:hypothetical protein
MFFVFMRLHVAGAVSLMDAIGMSVHAFVAELAMSSFVYMEPLIGKFEDGYHSPTKFLVSSLFFQMNASVMLADEIDALTGRAEVSKLRATSSVQ